MYANLYIISLHTPLNSYCFGGLLYPLLLLPPFPLGLLSTLKVEKLCKALRRLIVRPRNAVTIIIVWHNGHDYKLYCARIIIMYI